MDIHYQFHKWCKENEVNFTDMIFDRFYNEKLNPLFGDVEIARHISKLYYEVGLINKLLNNPVQQNQISKVETLNQPRETLSG